MRFSKMGNRILFALFIAAIALLFAGCQHKKEREAGQEVIPVKVAKVELKELYETLDYVGDIKAQDQALVYPKVTGKISEKVKEDSSPVNKGEVIAYIDRDEVGLRFEKAPVESPLSGIIGRVYVDIGENVSPSTAIALVVDMDKVKINLDIPEKYLPHISLGQNAKIAVDAYAKEEFLGKVTKISPVVDLTTRAAPIEITAENPGHRLKSGMFAKISLIVQEYKNVPVIFREAVIGKEPDTYTYIIENNKATLKKIKLGLRQGQYFLVLDGLKEGDLVVVMGQQRLYEGANVSTEKEKE